jgi:hypothetical protein
MIFLFAKCKRDDLGRHVYVPQPMECPASKSAGCYKVQVAGGNNKANLGKKRSAEQCAKISEALQGTKCSASTHAKISNAKKGK